MSWLLTDLTIAFILLLWILSCIGFGNMLLLYAEKLLKAKFFEESFALKIFLSLLLGVGTLSFLTQILHLFIAIDSSISIIFLLLGILFFILKIRDFNMLDYKVWLSGAIAFFAVGILSFYHDSMGDSVNYHIQIVTYIQNEPLVFGLGNIHGRLGFNGIIYNFYALSDVSQIIPHLRSFIGNEIVIFGFIFSLMFILMQRSFDRFYHLFLVCCAIPFSFILTWGEFRGLYCEGIGAVLGIFIFTCILYVLQNKNNKLLYILFILSIFASMVKIANTALLAGVVIAFIYLNKNTFYKREFLKSYAILAIISFIFVLPWALKGIATSGMVAYPANVFFFKSLPFSVLESQRESEVCWIMSWARDPGKNCKEVLASHAWMKDWFSMEIRYFKWYFKYFIYALFANLALLAILLFIKRGLKREIILVAFGILCGIIFWFVSGPDPRFGMVYIIPLLGLLYSYNLSIIINISNKTIKIILLVAFIASLTPFWKLSKDIYLILLFLWILFTPKRYYKIYCTLLIALSFIAVVNIYRKNLGGIATLPKVLPIFASKKLTDYGLEVYVRTDKQMPDSTIYDYEPTPMTPYFNENIKKDRFLGRDAYINTKKD